MPLIIMLVGFPASGKGTLAKQYAEQGFTILNRDTEGGKVTSLIPKMETAIQNGEDVVLDNTFGTVEERAPFIEAATKLDVKIECIHVNTSIDDAQINALHRMYDRYGKIFYTADDIRDHDEAKKDPNCFPIAALFSFRKRFEKPTKDEGFMSVTKHKFERKPLPAEFNNAAIIFDYDETLRTVGEGTEYKYPISPDEVNLLPGRVEKLKALADSGMLILGISNQSGIAKGHLSMETALECFERTNELLGMDIDVRFCSHSVPPIKCYCRKPQVGIGVDLIREYKLDPNKVTFVGDMTSDKTFANKLGFTYYDQADFFA